MLWYERLKQNHLFSQTKNKNISAGIIKVFVYKRQSLSKHIDNIVNVDRTTNNGITGFIEIQINSLYCNYLQNNGNINLF